jgi:hypothetical protein
MTKGLSILTLFSFLITGIMGPRPLYAQDFYLPAPGVMVHLSPEFDPPVLTGIKVHPDNPLRFDFILDQGDSPSLIQEANREILKQEAAKLIKYFLTSLTIPEKDLWVNLSPYEKDRIIPNSFGLTEMGRDLLAEDYMLKQITASLIYPEEQIGRRFWKRIYEEAAKKFDTTDIPVSTFNKVWIVPEKAVVYENAKTATAYVVESKLKVMLEEDYLSLSKHSQARTSGRDVNALGGKIVREIVIPELTKEVNEDKNFARLRQVYNSIILATWYRQKIKDSILQQVYTDKNKLGGIDNDDPQEKEKIYQRYLKAFRKGAFNYIKEESLSDPGSPGKEQGISPRKYFSGGVVFDLTQPGAGRTNFAMTAFKVTSDKSMVGHRLAQRPLVVVEENMSVVPSLNHTQSGDHAMASVNQDRVPSIFISRDADNNSISGFNLDELLTPQEETEARSLMGMGKKRPPYGKFDAVVSALTKAVSYLTKGNGIGLHATTDDYIPVKFIDGKSQADLIQKVLEEKIKTKRSRKVLNVYDIGIGQVESKTDSPEHGWPLEALHIVQALTKAFEAQGISHGEQAVWTVNLIGLDYRHEFIEGFVDKFVKNFNPPFRVYFNLNPKRARGADYYSGVVHTMWPRGMKQSALQRPKADIIFYRHSAYPNVHVPEGDMDLESLEDTQGNTVTLSIILQAYLSVGNILDSLAIKGTYFIVEPAMDNDRGRMFHVPGADIMSVTELLRKNSIEQAKVLSNTGTGIYKIDNPSAVKERGLISFVEAQQASGGRDSAQLSEKQSKFLFDIHQEEKAYRYKSLKDTAALEADFDGDPGLVREWKIYQEFRRAFVQANGDDENNGRLLDRVISMASGYHAHGKNAINNDLRPYIIHPLETAYDLVRLGLTDKRTVLSALFHDVFEKSAPAVQEPKNLDRIFNQLNTDEGNQPDVLITRKDFDAIMAVVLGRMTSKSFDDDLIHLDFLSQGLSDSSPFIKETSRIAILIKSTGFLQALLTNSSPYNVTRFVMTIRTINGWRKFLELPVIPGGLRWEINTLLDREEILSRVAASKDRAMAANGSLLKLLREEEDLTGLITAMSIRGHEFENAFGNYDEELGVYVIPDEAMRELFAFKGVANGDGQAFNLLGHVGLKSSTVHLIKAGDQDALYFLKHEQAHTKYLEQHPGYVPGQSIEQTLVDEIYAQLDGFISAYGRDRLFEKMSAKWNGAHDWIHYMLNTLAEKYVGKDVENRKLIIIKINYVLSIIHLYLKQEDQDTKKIMAYIRQSKNLDDILGIAPLYYQQAFVASGIQPERHEAMLRKWEQFKPDSAMAANGNLLKLVREEPKLAGLLSAISELGLKFEDVFRNYDEALGVYVIPDEVMALVSQMMKIPDAQAFNLWGQVAIKSSVFNQIKDGDLDALYVLRRAQAHSKYLQKHPKYVPNQFIEQTLVDQIFAILDAFILTYGRDGLLEKIPVQGHGEQDEFHYIANVLDANYVGKDVKNRKRIIDKLNYALVIIDFYFRKHEDAKMMAFIRQSENFDEILAIAPAGFQQHIAKAGIQPKDHELLMRHWDQFTPDAAMRAGSSRKADNVGGIDLTAGQMPLKIRNSGPGIKFHLDPTLVQQLQNAPGFLPVIINIQPLKDLSVFLGLN